MIITEVYDIETLSNLFTYTGYSIQENKIYQFVIHKSRNEAQELYDHLTRTKKMYQVGFNNEAFDYPVLHYFLLNFRKKYKQVDGETIATDLYKEAQRVINDDFSIIWDNKRLIHQTDLFKIWHYNNKARITSLKDLQFAMQMKDIEEMPLDHTHWCTSKDIDMILNYNKNDVEATYLFLLTTLGKTEHGPYKGRDKMALRNSIDKTFKIRSHNLADVPLGEELMLTLYSRATQTNKWNNKQLRTRRIKIDLKDCVPHWAKIKSKEFNEFLDDVNNTTIYPGEKYSKSVVFHGIRFDFGLGGSHGCIKSGVYNSDQEYVIMDLDVASLYPSIAKNLGIYPAHLGPEFIKLYSQFIVDRMDEKNKPKEEQNMVLIEGYKLILNGSYGKTGDEHSFLYDLLYMYKTTIAGQLLIAIWSERMVEAVPDLVFIQINTDGISIRIKREDVDKILAVTNKLTDETGFIFEDNYYSKMVIRDVNNYMSVFEGSTFENERIVYKGVFEIDKEYHKDSSMRIVPIALKEYFVYGIPIEQTIRNHNNIFDFCLRLKKNNSSTAQYTYLDDNGDVQIEELGRTTRYFVSNQGGAIGIYYNGSNSLNRRHIGYVTTLFNKYYEAEDYNINYHFYATETRKILNTVEDNQLSLF